MWATISQLEAPTMSLNAALPPVYELRTSIGEFGRGERSHTAANSLIGDLDPASLPGPRPRDHGRRQATAALGTLCMTR
jgi:hypothetical protein